MKDLLKGKDKVIITEAKRGLKQTRSYDVFLEGDEQPILTIAEKSSAFKNIMRLMGGGASLGRIKLTATDTSDQPRFFFRVQSAIDAISMKGSLISDKNGEPIGKIRWKMSTDAMFDIENLNKERLYEVGYESSTSTMRKDFTFAREGQRVAESINANSFGESFKNAFRGGGDKYGLQFHNIEKLTDQDIIFIISGMIHFDVEKDRDK